MNARYYVPGIGRFASADSIVPDPRNPQSMNRYSYARNNPVNRVDPTGHVDCGDMPWECSEQDWSNNGTKPSASETLASYCARAICDGEGIATVSVYVQGDLIQLPYHIEPNYNSPEQLYPWEAPADVLYAEHSSLHPSKYDNRLDWQMWFDQTWELGARGILQTMTNRAESDNWKVNTPTEAALSPTQYAKPGRDVMDPAWQDSMALSFDVVMMGSRIDQPYDYFSHQDLNDVRGYVPDNRNALCCNERVAFGPNSGSKDYYVVYYTTLSRPAQ